MALLDEFVAAFGVWEEARPYIQMIADEQEMELVVRMQGQSVAPEEVADLLGMTYQQTSAFLQRCYSRCIVNKTVENGITTYSAADFGARLDHFVKFENWDDIPAAARKAIDHRFLKENVRFDPEKCWGCGLCANTCPSGAIIMESLL